MEHLADVVFVKVDGGQYHRVWISRIDGRTHGVRLHVVHDLPHFAVESALGIDDGLWGTLVDSGTYPGLTPEHLVAKALTNAIAATPTAMRAVLYRHQRPDIARREGFDRDRHRRTRELLDQRMAALDESALPLAVEMRSDLLRRWAATPVGDKLTLPWPLAAADSP